MRRLEIIELRLGIADEDFAGGGVLFLDLYHGRDPFLEVLYVGDDADMLAAGGVQFLQCRHHAVEPLLAECSESFIDEEGIHADAVLCEGWTGPGPMTMKSRTLHRLKECFQSGQHRLHCPLPG